VRVAGKVAEAIGAGECLVAGGLAVMAHGFVRGTRDVDLLTRLSLSEARRRLKRKGLPTRLVKGDPFEGGFSCLKGECDGLPFDVLPQIVPVHWEAAVPVATGGAAGLRVVPLIDLLAMKLKAQGAKDLMDAAMLVLMHPETEARARELAIAYGALERLETWLDDPRARAQAREELEHEKRRPRERAAEPTATPRRSAGPHGPPRPSARRPRPPGRSARAPRSRAFSPGRSAGSCRRSRR